MANKDFGVKKIELIGSSGTPNLTSPTNLNLNANTVAISTDVTIGGKVQSDVIVGTGYSVGIGSTQPQQAIDVTGTIRATSFFGNGSGLTGVTGTGSGVEVHDNDAAIGTASTINFGANLSVSAVSNGICTVTSQIHSRTTVSGSTTSIGNNGIGNTDITGFKSYALMKVGLSTAGWLRIYTDSASRSADSTRSVGEDPAAGSGVIAEVVTTGISTQQNISPFTIGGNMDDPVDTTIYVAITNQSGTTQSITANLTILKLEE